MQKVKISHVAKVAYHPINGFVLFLDEFKLNSCQDRFFYVMDKSGNHDLIHESEIYHYCFYSRVTCNDSRDLLILLKELSMMSDLKNQIMAIIETFKLVYCHD